MDHAASDLYPLTCPAWVALPGDEAPTSIALGVSKALKPTDLDKVVIFGGINVMTS